MIVIQRGGYRAGTVEREITLQFGDICRLCTRALSPGARALYAKDFGVRCIEDASGEPTCISALYDEDEHP